MNCPSEIAALMAPDRWFGSKPHWEMEPGGMNFHNKFMPDILDTGRIAFRLRSQRSPAFQTHTRNLDVALDRSREFGNMLLCDMLRNIMTVKSQNRSANL